MNEERSEKCLRQMEHNFVIVIIYDSYIKKKDTL
jgi:hypothetical protein